MADLVQQFAELPQHRQATLLAISVLLDAGQPQRTPLKEHGSWAAYKRHLRAGQCPCDPCKEASRQRSIERNEARRRG